LERCADGYLSEDDLINAFIRFFNSIALYIGVHVRVHDFEVDALIIEPGVERPSVYMVEAKRKPKVKLIRQIRRRCEFSDYVYVVLPYTAYSWALKYIPTYVGIVIVDRGLNPHVIRLAKWLGNGEEILYLANKGLTQQLIT